MLQAVPLVLEPQVTEYFQPTVTEGWQWFASSEKVLWICVCLDASRRSDEVIAYVNGHMFFSRVTVMS